MLKKDSNFDKNITPRKTRIRSGGMILARVGIIVLENNMNENDNGEHHKLRRQNNNHITSISMYQ